MSFKPAEPGDGKVMRHRTLKDMPEFKRHRSRMQKEFHGCHCPICGEVMRSDVGPAHPQKLVIDHILTEFELKEQGLSGDALRTVGNDAANLRPLCRVCNGQRPLRTVDLGAASGTTASGVEHLNGKAFYPRGHFAQDEAGLTAWLAQFDCAGTEAGQW